MGFDPTPWFVGGGAHHSPAVARLLAYAGTSGQEGVVGPADFKVSPLGSPGASVTLAAGAAVILNRSAGGQQQSYVMRAPTSTSVGVAATGASPRSDLVVLRVEDPEFSPWQVPTDPVAAQYVFPRIIQGVPANTTDAGSLNLGYSALAVARLDIPANTSAITSGMIKDVRRLTQPGSRREVLAGKSSIENQDQTASTYQIFPSYGPTVSVPRWATHAIVQAHVASVAVIGAGLTDFRGLWRVRLGGLAGVDQDYDFDTSGGNYRTTETVVGEFDVRSIAGTDKQLLVETLRSAGTGNLRSVRGTRLVFDVQFVERAV